MQVEVLHHLPAGLEELALQSNQSTFYHTPIWLESLAGAYPATRLNVIAAVDSGHLLGYLPFFEIRKGAARRLWSLPFGTYGGPVTLGDSAVERALLETFVAMKSRRGVYEIGLVDFHGRLSVPALEGIQEATHLLDLESGFDVVWSDHFEKSKRRQTRRAEREGLVVQEAGSIDEVRSYYEIYKERSAVWRQRVSYPENLFIDLLDRGGERVKLFLAWKDDTLLGGHLNFYFKNTVIAWNGVTKASSRGTQAGTLLYATCIRHACEAGYHEYNLGGSLGSDSLVEYKQALGARSHPYVTLRWRSLGARIASAVMKYLPKQ
jgi:CelD/BcsL family acetyltransferase involved in cellulose biosynthesis